MSDVNQLNEADHARRVAVRMVDRHDDLDVMDLDVVEISRDCDRVQYDHKVIGYIQHVGHVFVALSGSRLDRAEECAQCLLWDHAAAELMHQARMTLRAKARPVVA